MQFILTLSVFLLFSIGRCGNNDLQTSRKDRRTTHVNCPDNWVDGDIITVYFNHTNNLKENDYEGAVTFTFSNAGSGKNHIWIMFTLHAPLAVYTGDYDEALPGTPKSGHYDENPPISAPWRIDFLKLSKYEVLPFLQGVHPQMRTFTNNLDDTDAFDIRSKSIDHSTVKTHKLLAENSLTQQMNLENFNNHLEDRKYRILAEFPSWPIGMSIDISAYMQTDTWRASPLFGFKSFTHADKCGLAIEHHRHENNHTLLMYTRDEDGTIVPNETTECWKSPGRGDLHHFHFERISEEKVKLTSRFLDTYEGISCEMESKHLKEWFDGKVQLFVENGAVVLHTTHSGMNP